MGFNPWLRVFFPPFLFPLKRKACRRRQEKIIFNKKVDFAK